jgi:hypothetical protein
MLTRYAVSEQRKRHMFLKLRATDFRRKMGKLSKTYSSLKDKAHVSECDKEECTGHKEECTGHKEESTGHKPGDFPITLVPCGCKAEKGCREKGTCARKVHDPIFQARGRSVRIPMGGLGPDDPCPASRDPTPAPRDPTPEEKEIVTTGG